MPNPASPTISDNDCGEISALIFGTPAQIERLRANAARKGITPSNCPYCEYDRRFPGFKRGGWLRSKNNGPGDHHG